MSVTKLVCLSAMIAGLVTTTSARADAILTLGVFSSPAETASSAPTPAASAGNLALSDSTNQSTPSPSSFAPATFASASSPAAAPASSQSAPLYDAFINFGTAGYANAGSLTTGGAEAWYDSSKITGLFGGQPNAQQIASFDATVLQRVQQTFALGGVPVALTDDPNQAAAHMLSVVSNAVNPSMNNAIGMTYVGGNGFHFIDNSAPYAKSVDQLEWIVAHNVAHELMLAFGVPEVHDQTGQYIDSTTGSISMFLNPNATFSTGAAQALLANNFLQVNGSVFGNQAQLMGPSPTPEPATLAAWATVLGALIAARRARSRRASA